MIYFFALLALILLKVLNVIEMPWWIIAVFLMIPVLYIEILLDRCGIQLEVVNNVEGEKEDLIQDFVSVITSFSARIYGQRRSKRKTEQLIESLEEQKSEEA